MTSQESINEKQNTINEQTKVDISMRTLYAIIAIVMGATSFYLYNNFSMMTDIREIKTNVTYIKDGLDTHLNEAVQARKDMRAVAAQRDAKFNEIDQKLTTLKTILKIDY